MIEKLMKLPLLKRLIPSLGIRILTLAKKNRGYFNINNIRMFLDFLDPIDRQIILNKEYESYEFSTLSNLVEKYSIDNFIDVGANCGFYSYHLPKNLNVFAFEPNQEAFFKLNKTLELNHKFKERVKIYPFGISEENRNLKMKTKVKFGYVQTGGSSVSSPTEEKGHKIFHVRSLTLESHFLILERGLTFRAFLLVTVNFKRKRVRYLQNIVGKVKTRTRTQVSYFLTLYVCIVMFLETSDTKTKKKRTYGCTHRALTGFLIKR